MSTATQERPRDRYDQEVERLAGATKEEIGAAWCYGRDHSPLFDACAFDRFSPSFGCPTMVRAGDSAATPALSTAIRGDARIPLDPSDISDANLPVFAEIQRHTDRELGRTPPPMLPEPGS